MTTLNRVPPSPPLTRTTMSHLWCQEDVWLVLGVSHIDEHLVVLVGNIEQVVGVHAGVAGVLGLALVARAPRQDHTVVVLTAAAAADSHHVCREREVSSGHSFQKLSQ